MRCLYLLRVVLHEMGRVGVRHVVGAQLSRAERVTDRERERTGKIGSYFS